MGIYFSTRYEKEKGKKYLVMKRNRKSFIILLFLLLLTFATYFAPALLDSILGVIKYSLFLWVASVAIPLVLFVIAGTLLMIEQIKPTIARIKGKEIRIKGALFTFSKKPVEIWIEQ